MDITTRDKSALYPERYGYQRRGTNPTSIVIHTTEGVRGQSLNSASSYLYHSSEVSAHYLIGRGGEILNFLNPRTMQAWHAGESKVAFQNSRSIGIELLHARGEPYPQPQWAALKWLVEKLMVDYRIPADLIETHRAIALPAGRKSDPTDFDDAAFARWKAALSPVSSPASLTAKGCPVWQRQDCTGALAGFLASGERVDIDREYTGGVVHLASGLGFTRREFLD